MKHFKTSTLIRPRAGIGGGGSGNFGISTPNGTAPSAGSSSSGDGRTTKPLFTLSSTNGFTFQTSVLKDGYQVQKAANFNQIGILGRSSPLITYSNSTAKVLSIGFELAALKDAKMEVSDVLSSFMSLVYPVDPGIQPPGLCTVNIAEFKNWKCVVVDVNYSANGPWSVDVFPMFASVKLTLLEVAIQNISAKSVLVSQQFKQLAF